MLSKMPDSGKMPAATVTGTVTRKREAAGGMAERSR